MNIKDGKIIDSDLELSSVMIELPKSTISIIEGYGGFAMCAALDVSVYEERDVVCFNAKGVKNVIDLYNSKIYKSSKHAQLKGLYPGMNIRDAFKILKAEKD